MVHFSIIDGHLEGEIAHHELPIDLEVDDIDRFNAKGKAITGGRYRWISRQSHYTPKCTNVWTLLIDETLAVCDLLLEDTLCLITDREESLDVNLIAYLILGIFGATCY